MLAAALDIVEAAGRRDIAPRRVAGLAVQALCTHLPPPAREGEQKPREGTPDPA